MDRPVSKAGWNRWRIVTVLTLIGLTALTLGALWSDVTGRKLRVERATLTLATVRQRPFQEFIAVRGVVVPQTTVYLDAVEGGRVEEVFAQEGLLVAAGQPLLRLSNNNLQLQLLSLDAQRIEQRNRLQETRSRLTQNALDVRQQLAEMDYRLGVLARARQRAEQLGAKELISRQDVEEAIAEHEYYKRRRKLTLESFRQDSLRSRRELVLMERLVTRMEENYIVVRGIQDGLVVRAPVAGRLTGLDAEVGQLRTAGERLGQIDMLDGYEVEVELDEFYLPRIEIGQGVITRTIDEDFGFQLRVSRIESEVEGGRFRAYLEFVGRVPDGLRRGQTIRGRLTLGSAETVLTLPRGPFYRTTSGNWAYVIEDGSARRKSIVIGRQNPEYFEVLQGLKAGARVVVSSYRGLEDADRLIIE